MLFEGGPFDGQDLGLPKKLVFGQAYPVDGVEDGYYQMLAYSFLAFDPPDKVDVTTVRRMVWRTEWSEDVPLFERSLQGTFLATGPGAP
jgi:hypothetical protein